MPIFEFYCPIDGSFEVLFKRIPKRPVNARKCPQCGARSPMAYSLPVMRPDTLWAGQKTQYGYFTSASDLKAEMSRRNHVTMGDRTDWEGMDKVAEAGAKAKEDKLKRDMRKWSEKAFGPSGLGLGGADGEKLMKGVK